MHPSYGEVKINCATAGARDHADISYLRGFELFFLFGSSDEFESTCIIGEGQFIKARDN